METDSSTSSGSAGGEIFSPLQVYFYLVNTIMGSGFLGIPFVFQVAGDVISLIMLAFFSLVSYYIAMILIEAMSRAEAIQRIRDDGVQEIVPQFKRVMSCATPGDNTTLLSQEHRYEPQITPRKFELAEMHNTVIGSKARYVYLFFMFITYWSALLSYASVFGSSMADIIPLFGSTCNIYKSDGFGGECRYAYMVWIALFSGVTATLVFLGLKEQKWFQYVMSGFRLVTVLLILVLCVVRIGQGQVHPPTVAKAGGVGYLASLIFANSGHPSIPTYTQYMYQKKEYINKVLRYLFLTLFVLYSLLGVLMSLSFGELPAALVTLAWAGFADDYDGAWWAYIFMYLILLFPAVDSISAFPLNAITLSENLMSVKYPQLTIQELESLPRKTVFLFRSLTIIPPLVISFVAYNLGVIQTFAGLSDYYVVFGNIALLHLYTLHRFPKHSDYAGWWSNKKIALATFWIAIPLGIVNLAYVIYNLAA